jgi:hypothetical protein
MMQRPLNRALAGAVALALALASTAQAQVGLTSTATTVTLNATKISSLTVTPSTGTATLASITDNSSANVFSNVGLTTAWNLTGGTSVNVMGWFSTPTAALSNGTTSIPTANVEGGINSTGWAAFTSGAVGGLGVAGGSLQLVNQAITAANYLSSRTDQLNLRLNLVGFPSTTAGSYTGTLYVQAVVQ